jgi:ribosomal protein L40E
VSGKVCPRCGDEAPKDGLFCRACRRELLRAKDRYVNAHKGTEEDFRKEFMYPYLSEDQQEQIRKSGEGMQ